MLLFILQCYHILENYTHTGNYPGIVIRQAIAYCYEVERGSMAKKGNQANQVSEAAEQKTGFGKIVYKGGEGEIVEKKSRFIATVCPVKTEEEAVAFISEMKKKYWDARHNCSAFVLGERQEITRCSDDGEPAQTAGRPMLDVLIKEGIHDVAVVVTRYFGGVLLGTGGLVRAYQKAVQEGLAQSEVIEIRAGQLLEIETDYNGVGKLQYLFGQENISIMESEYGAEVKLIVLVPVEKKENLEKNITEQTSGKARISWADEVNFAIVEKKVKIFTKSC